MPNKSLTTTDTQNASEARMKKLFNSLGFLHPRNLRSLSLTQTVIASVFFAVLIAGLFVGNYARSTIYKNKLVDTWAIMFLESEALGTRLRDFTVEQIGRQNASASLVAIGSSCNSER